MVCRWPLVRNRYLCSKIIFVNAKILILVDKISTYLRIYEDSFGVRKLREDCALSGYKSNKSCTFSQLSQIFVWFLKSN